MTLDKWMTKTQTTGYALAREIKTSQQNIGHWRHGHNRPNAAWMQRIEDYTGGAVTAADFPKRARNKRTKGQA